MNIRVLLALSVLFSTPQGQAQACPFSRFLAFEKQGPLNPQSPVSWAQFQNELPKVFQEEARQFFQKYQTGEVSALEVESCKTFSTRLTYLIETQLPHLFLTSATEQLSRAQSRAVKRFSSAIFEHQHSSHVFPGSLDLNSVPSPDQPVAGFDRESMGLFFRLNLIHPEAWNIYYIHEYAHALDPLLKKGIQDYSSPEVVNPAIDVIKTGESHFRNLKEDQKQALLRYLRAGAERGIFAEWRAWVITSFLYQELRKHDEQKTIQWFEAIIGQEMNQTSAQLKTLWWNHVRSNFKIPNEGLFKNPLMIEAHEEMLNQVNPLTEDMGYLGQWL